MFDERDLSRIVSESVTLKFAEQLTKLLLGQHIFRKLFWRLRPVAFEAVIQDPNWASGSVQTAQNVHVQICDNERAANQDAVHFERGFFSAR